MDLPAGVRGGLGRGVLGSAEGVEAVDSRVRHQVHYSAFLQLGRLAGETPSRSLNKRIRTGV